MDKVMLVDKHNHQIGTMGKIRVYREGLLHRAFSIPLINFANEILLQKRADGKYRSGGLWTNTCCSNSMPGESINDAVKRRLKEEMCIDLQPNFCYSFIHKGEFEAGLMEHELDHVFIGTYDGAPSLNKVEASDWKYKATNDLKSDLKENPKAYSHWFNLIMNHPEMENYLTVKN
jgi:isopentenyl-diphosphate Delta-isomerase